MINGESKLNGVVQSGSRKENYRKDLLSLIKIFLAIYLFILRAINLNTRFILMPVCIVVNTCQPMAEKFFSSHYSEKRGSFTFSKKNKQNIFIIRRKEYARMKMISYKIYFICLCILNPCNYTDKIQFDSFSNSNVDGYLFIKFSIIE